MRELNIHAPMYVLSVLRFHVFAFFILATIVIMVMMVGCAIYIYDDDEGFGYDFFRGQRHNAYANKTIYCNNAITTQTRATTQDKSPCAVGGNNKTKPV